MLKFNEQKKIDSVNGALGLRSTIENTVDDINSKGFKNICWLGIGGTYASAMQVVVHMKEKTSLEVFYENAAEYLTTGNKRISESTVVVISSVTGSTLEMVDGIKKAKDAGAIVLGFIDVEDTELARMTDYLVSYPENEQLKFFMTADRFMYKSGEFDDYEEKYKEYDKYLAKALVEVEKAADEFAECFANEHHNDEMHYFIGAGNQYGATYSYAMCYWEEQHWIKTKSIHSAEFFHGMFEIVEKDTPVTVYVTEDSQRELSMRVVKFLPKICANYTVIDTKEYELLGISEKYRGSISPLVIHAVNNRIDVHIEKLNCHPMEIRRYYRQLDY